MGEAQTVLTDIEKKIEVFLTELKDKSETELAKLYSDALVEEAKLKVEVVVLRQRAANMSSDAEVEVEKLIIKAKENWQTALAKLKAIEQKLFGKDAVKDFNTGSSKLS